MSGADWKSYADQLQILTDRGLLVRDSDIAILDLERIGYYCLSGYWYPFRILKDDPDAIPRKEDQFVAGSYFEDAVALYIFDKDLRLMALDALERIERAIRVDVAHLLGQRDSFAHHDPLQFYSNFGSNTIAHGRNAGKTQHQLWMEHYYSLIKRNHSVAFVAHNMGKYGKLPIWVAIEILDFGSLSRLFAGMKIADKNKIAAKYRLQSGRQLEKWLRSLNFFRNVAAHHSRMWNMNIIEVAPKPQFDGNWQSLNNHQPFMYFSMMQYLMQVIVPESDWGGRFKSLVQSFPEPVNSAVKASDFGVVDGWESWGLWK